MLVVSRKLGEKTYLVDKKTGKKLAEIIIVDIDRNKIRIGIDASKDDIEIYRHEIAPAHVTNEQAPPSVR